MPEGEFAWQCWPESERFLIDQFAELMTHNAWAKDFADRLRDQTGTTLTDWVDHVQINGTKVSHEMLRGLGFKPRRGEDSVPTRRIYTHPGADLPHVVVNPHASEGLPSCLGVAIRVENAAAFLAANRLHKTIQGNALGPYREVLVAEGLVNFWCIERRGYDGFDLFPSSLARSGQLTPQRARNTIEAKEMWQTRQRHWAGDDASGFDHAMGLAGRMIGLVGRDLACELIFEVEREFWESRNRSARGQKFRQDRLGLSWANHDHHTFRCSRRNFHRLISVFEMLGFRLRENFHAGENAGWGAQILDHPVTGIVIFADLDLQPDELSADFCHTSLEPLPRPNTVGLWVALHGESFLEAGMHHLEAQFDFEQARDGLEREFQVQTMKPFSDFPFLRQAFTKGENWQVDPRRIDAALRAGWIDVHEAQRFATEGAIGSHLEILERKQGYKGFNQQAVSAILGATDPRRVIPH